jgi:hypothetical protein
MGNRLVKRFLVCFFMGSIFLFSCKKEHSGPTNTDKPSAKNYSVNFNVKDFTKTIINGSSKLKVNSISTDSVPIKNYLSVLYYCVYDSNGRIFHALVQNSTQSNFGNLADNLPAGTYTIVMAGAAGDKVFANAVGDNLRCSALSLLSSPAGLPTTTLNSTYIYNQGGTWDDTFFSKFQITVTGNSNQAVTLNRIVGKLEIDILDALPVNAAWVTISISPEATKYLYSNEQLFFPTQNASSGTSTTVPASAIGTTHFSPSMIVANTVKPFKVNITCYDASGSVIATAAVDDVICQVNTRTILSGKLFDNIVNNNQFSVSLNANWNTPVKVGF